MSASDQTAGPLTDNFTAIFNAASTEYHNVTGKRLDTHPFVAQLDVCRSPDAVSNLLRMQAQAFSKFRKRDEKLMAWLVPIIHILLTFSATLAEGIRLPFSPAKTIFTGIGVLLGAVRDVAASHDAVIHTFERIHFFLQRLNIYIGIPLTDELTGLLGKIMAHLLCILALSTKVMADSRTKNILKKLVGRKDVEDALQKLDTLTNEETSMTLATNLKVTHDVDSNVVEIKHITNELKRNQLQEKFRTWLSPPDPSINHNTAHKTQHSGTATWFIEGSTFREWKKKCPLLWIRGNRTLLPSFCLYYNRFLP
ncbi:hypothetical protein BC827DRAFT_1252878 [Russula dissimulans]|nr:hypothetical protein BC827DRAFT_1252878 [Russula dissimulans]